MLQLWFYPSFRHAYLININIFSQSCMCTSYVLFKEFLPKDKEKFKSRRNISPRHQMTIKDLINQIHKAKTPNTRGQQLEQYEKLLINNNDDRNKDDGNTTKGVLQKSKKSKHASHYFWQKRKNSTSPSEFRESQLHLTLHQSLPVREEEKTDKSKLQLKLFSKLNKTHCFPKTLTTYKLTKHRNTEMLKLDLSLLQKKRAKSQNTNYAKTKEENKNGSSKLTSHLLNPQDVRSNTISDRADLKKKVFVRLSNPKDIKMAQLKIRNSEVQLIIREEIQYVPQQLKSNKVIFQKKDNLRKQFLINVRKINKLNNHQEQISPQEHSQTRVHNLEKSSKKLRNNATFHVRSSTKTQEKWSVSKRTHTQAFKFKYDYDNEPIEPW